MPKIRVGNDDVNINISSQLEAPFMVSMSGSNMANLIGRVTGVETIDYASAEISKEITRYQRSIGSLEKDIEQLSEDLKEFDDLEDDLEKIQVLTAFIASNPPKSIFFRNTKNVNNITPCKIIE